MGKKSNCVAKGCLKGVGEQYTANAPAKVNLFLEVIGKRADSYHDIISVFQEVDLCDSLVAELSGDCEIEISCDDPTIPLRNDNLVYRAIELLRNETGVKKGMRVHIEKRIPVGGGLGGGSSDAASAILLANDLWELGLEKTALASIAAKIGSDVPFFLWGGTCLCEGRGERVTPLPTVKALDMCLVLPPWGISTVAAYKALAGIELGTRKNDVGKFLKALESGDAEKTGARSFNRFEEAVFKLEPRQAKLSEKLFSCGFKTVRMSGSGSSVWCLGEAYETDALQDICGTGKDLGFKRVKGRCR